MKKGLEWIVAGILSWSVAFPLCANSFRSFWNHAYVMQKVRDSFYSKRNNEITFEKINEVEEDIRKIEERFYSGWLKSTLGMGASAGLFGIGYACFGFRGRRNF